MRGDLNQSGARTDTVERKLDALSACVDERFDAVDRRFKAVDRRFDEVTEAIGEQRQYTEFAFDRLTNGLSRVERKLDQFIDTQSKTNELVERRLRVLERSNRL